MIEVESLSKSYGDRPVVDGISFALDKGRILGFLGPNGAGKTTTMRILTCFMPATSGNARVAGFDVFNQSMEVRRRVGYLPENPPLYDEMTVRSYLEFTARLRSVPRRKLKSRIDAVADQCGLGTVMGRVIGHLSRGFRQRVGLGQALVHEPEVLILDEPTIGLDPAQIVEIRQVIKSLGGEHTIIFSTHILPEVTAACDSVFIINEGKAVAAGPLGSLVSRDGDLLTVHLQVARDEERIAEALGGMPGIMEVHKDAARAGTYRLRTDPGIEVREKIAGRVAQEGWGLLEMTPVSPSLEDIYLDLITGSGSAAA